MKLQRILIGFGAPALAWLRGESARIGISVNELVRRCVDKEREYTTRLRQERLAVEQRWERRLETEVKRLATLDGKDGKR